VDAIKLYAYADETGQESAGRIFLVAVVVVGRERDALLPWLEDLEARTGKGRRPWRRSRPAARTAYVERILAEPRLAGSIFYSAYAGIRDYRDLTLVTIANAVAAHAAGRRFKVTVIIDGLRRDEVHAVSVGLRRLRIPVRKVRGARDESNALGRLADAMAGFVRDAEEGVPEWGETLARAMAQGIVRRV
jgi:pimeloyl-ACP methyl ester carboxylesterase